MSILIVDDTASQRLLMSAILKSAGYTEILSAQSPNDAFRLLGMGDMVRIATRVDLVLMDVNMPEIDGIEATRRIKATDGLQDIPIIMVTASTEPEDLQAAFDAGAIDYINKPPNKAEMMARVRSALRLKREMDQRKAREQELVEVTRQLSDVNQRMEEAFVELDEQHHLVRAEQENAERLLLNILPAAVADRLKREQGVIADSYPDATVLFADIVGFTELAARFTPAQIVGMLNEVFSVYDLLAEKHGLEKIKTVGDAYMAVAGVPVPQADHADAAAEMALDIKAEIARHLSPDGEPLQARIGMNTGPLIAGVVGTKKFAYDLWGDTVNTACRMESHGIAGSIQVTAETYLLLRENYTLAERGTIEVKGKGEMVTYFLMGRKAPPR